MRLGQISTTGDPEGELTDQSARIPSRDELEAALVPLRGTITQKPPIYSAIKINGQRAYKLARAGGLPDMPERTVTIHKLRLDRYDYPEAHITCSVSSGTYIRSLVETIGEQLKTGAYTYALRRIMVGNYAIADAQQLDEPFRLLEA